MFGAKQQVRGRGKATKTHERGEPILARDHGPDLGHDQKNQEHPLLDLVDTNLQSLSNRNAFGTTSSVETSEITRQRPFLRGLDLMP